MRNNCGRGLGARGIELGWLDSVMPGWVRGRMNCSRSC
jgi:hypothetical protein